MTATTHLRPIRPLSRACLTLGIAALTLVLLVPPASADVVHLRSGETVKGRLVPERSTDKYLTVEDYLTGAYRRFDWSVVDPADRETIEINWGVKSTGERTVIGEAVEIRLDDGSTTVVRGVVESEDASTIYLRKDGDLVEVPMMRVVGRDAEEMDVRDVWTAKQLVAKLMEDMRESGSDPENLTAQEHWNIATWAEWVEELEAALEHYGAAAADETFSKRDMCVQRLAQVEALLQDQAALQTLRSARMKLRMNLFRKVREILEAFPETHPEASEEVLKRLEMLRASAAERRTTQLQLVARRRFVKILQSLIGAKVREKGLAITDLTSWTRRELPEEAFLRLAERSMGKLDDVTPDEAKVHWENRGESGAPKPRDEEDEEVEDEEPRRLRIPWKRVTYGAGTFIVDPPQIKPPKRRRPRSSAGRGSGGGGSVEIPKPPTRDQWWQKASIREREQWVLAYFVERSELFEVGEHEYRPCPMCHGVGLLSKTLQTGEMLTYLCTRCGGAQHDVIVKFR